MNISVSDGGSLVFRSGKTGWIDSIDASSLTIGFGLLWCTHEVRHGPDALRSTQRVEPRVEAPNQSCHLSAKRSCGGCTGCCTVMHVSSVGKKAGQRCQFECETGCAIYETRPAQCRSDFFCLWVRDDGRILDDACRPDRIGVVLTDADDGKGGRNAIAARELFHGAARKPKARAMLKKLAAVLPLVVVSPLPGVPAQLTVGGRPAETARARTLHTSTAA